MICDAVRLPIRRAIVLLPPRLLFGALMAVLIGVAAYSVLQEGLSDQPCPHGSRTVHPTALHFEPGIVEHQNWAEIPPREIRLGETIFLCKDGVLIGAEHMAEDDLVANAVILRIPTRWVDLAWLSGNLDGYRDQTRWVVVFPPFGSAPRTDG